MSPSPSSAHVRGGMVLLSLVWGSTYLVIRQGLEHLPPFGSAAARFFLAWLAFRLLAARLSAREGGRAPTVRDTLVMGLACVAVPYAIVYWSERVLPSGLVSVLWAVYPLFMASAAHLFLGERLRLVQALGFLVGFAGVVVLFLGDLRALGPEAITAGLVLLGSPLTYCLGTLYVKRHCAEVSSLRLNAQGLQVGAVALALLALATERDATWTLNAPAIGSLVYLSLVGTVVTFSVFWWLMRYAPASELALIAYVIPAVALTLGHLVDDDPLRTTTFAGTGLVLLGVYLARRERARP